jgi:MFS superfamily sulfate permease-like transporter
MLDSAASTPLFGLSSYALPFALSPVHTLIPSAAVAAAVATAAACACATPRPSTSPHYLRSLSFSLPPSRTAIVSGGFFAPSRSFALAPSHP